MSQEKVSKIWKIIKIHIAFIILNLFYRRLYKKEIWLIAEKRTEARDNGYHFFKFMREKHPDKNVYYVITKNSVDRVKIEKYENIIDSDSFLHYLYALAAKYSIGSQPYGALPSPAHFFHRFSYLRKKQKVIFLQHGIIKDELSHEFDYKKTGFDIFTTSSGKEYEFIKDTYAYPAGKVQLLGLCRFDNLYHQEDKLKNQILIMPTFRSWLKANNAAEYATKEEMKRFIQSEYYQVYSELLSSKELKKLLGHYDYRIVFYPHYALQSYIKSFECLQNDRIVIADRYEYDVQELMIESKIMVTDFSSVFFDFAYMKKPEIFFQFDEEKFRDSHYKKGYFDYTDDGFGPVVKTVDEVICELEKIIKNNGEVDGFYQRRIDDFFDLHDDKNCERTYEAIMSLK